MNIKQPSTSHCPSIAFLALAAVLLLASPPASRADTIYVSTWADSGSIEKYDSATGAHLGTFASASTGVSGPNGLAFDRAGNLYAANYGNNTIEKFTPGGGGSVFASLNTPWGLAFDSAGNLYAASFDSSLVEKFTPGGVGSAFASTGYDRPQSLAFDSAGNLYVGKWGDNNTIEKFSPIGADLGGFAPNMDSRGLAFDSAGNLYAIFGNYANRIEKFSPTGADLGVFASTGYNWAEGLAFDSAGNLYVADHDGGFVEKFTPGGIGSVFASGLNDPSYIAIQVPEPSTWALLAIALPALLALRRRASSAMPVSETDSTSKPPQFPLGN